MTFGRGRSWFEDAFFGTANVLDVFVELVFVVVVDWRRLVGLVPVDCG